MSGGRQSKGSRATIGHMPTQKIGRHHSFSSSTEDSSKPGSVGNPYVDGSNVSKATGRGSGTKGRPDSKTKTPRVQNGVAAGSGRSGWKNDDWS